MNKIYEIEYSWIFNNEDKSEAHTNFKFAISAHSKKDAIKYFKEHCWKDDNTSVVSIDNIKIFSIEEYLHLNLNIPKVVKG